MAVDQLEEGRDYNLENGLFVLTQHYLLRRGYCCQNGCRHCPYGFKKGLKEDKDENRPPSSGSR